VDAIDHGLLTRLETNLGSQINEFQGQTVVVMHVRILGPTSQVTENFAEWIDAQWFGRWV
jgi:hypothetical protein